MNGLFSGPYFTVRPTKFKRVFYCQNTLEGKWNTFKGKGGQTKKKNKTQKQKCQIFDSPAIDSSFYTMTHKTCVTVQFVKTLSSVKFLSHIFVSDIYGRGIQFPKKALKEQRVKSTLNGVG